MDCNAFMKARRERMLETDHQKTIVCAQNLNVRVTRMLICAPRKNEQIPREDTVEKSTNQLPRGMQVKKKQRRMLKSWSSLSIGGGQWEEIAVQEPIQGIVDQAEYSASENETNGLTAVQEDLGLNVCFSRFCALHFTSLYTV
jgi:hypothetical protein